MFGVRGATLGAAQAVFRPAEVIGFEPLDQPPPRMENLQQHRQQEAFGRDRGPTDQRLERRWSGPHFQRVLYSLFGFPCLSAVLVPSVTVSVPMALLDASEKLRVVSVPNEMSNAIEPVGHGKAGNLSGEGRGLVELERAAAWSR
jgi:hypothetical protein